MKINLYTRNGQNWMDKPEFNLPPHGPIVFAAALADYVDVDFVDENVQSLSYYDPVDLVCISMMLTSQIKRGWEIADTHRAKGIKVLFGGISTMLHAEETMNHADSIFMGEAEGHMEEVLDDFSKGKLKKLYNFMNHQPDTQLVGPARRDLLERDLYYHKGVQMVDLFMPQEDVSTIVILVLFHSWEEGNFRPRPFDRIAEELDTIDNNRLFVVDNTLAQDIEWTKELFRTMIPFKKKWCSHTIADDPEVLDLAAQGAGSWYVYQAVFDTSDYIKERDLKDTTIVGSGISVEGTILLGMDNQTEDDIKRLLDFIGEINLDLAEFTVLTPFPETKAYDDMLKRGVFLTTIGIIIRLIRWYSNHVICRQSDCMSCIMLPGIVFMLPKARNRKCLN